MAEYQGYIAPLAQSQSYSDALQARMDVIRQQQMQNMQLLLDAKNKQDAMTTQQLEKLYSLRTNGWGEGPIKAFAEQRDTFAQKLKSNQYTDQASFLADLSKLADTHAMFSSHYETTNPIIRQTQQYMARPGLYPDKTMKVTESTDTITQKTELQRNLGISTSKIAEDGSIQYFGADGKLLDLSDAMNPATYLPKVEPVFVSPSELTEQYGRAYQLVLNNGKNGDQFVASMLKPVTQRVKNDPSLMHSAQIYHMDINGALEIPEDQRLANETNDDFYARFYAEAALNAYKGTKRQSASTGGGGSRSAAPAAQKPSAIMSVTASKGQTEGFSLKDPISGQTLIPGAKSQSYYEYTFPDAIAEVNLAPFVDEEMRAQTEGKLDYDIQGLRFNQNGDIILPGVFIGDTKVGDVTIKRGEPVYNQIGAALKKEYGYDITQWTNGGVYNDIQAQSFGSPQTSRPVAGTVLFD